MSDVNTRMELVPVEKINTRESERIRSVFDGDRLKSLMDSISKVGQLQPILIDSDFNLIAGGRRLEAMKRLGRPEIEAKIIPIEAIADSTMSEIDENEEREQHSFSESLRIYDVLNEKYNKQRKGRPAKDIDSEEDKNRNNYSYFIPKGVKTSEWIAQKIKRFGNKHTLQQALSIRANDKTEGVVIDDLDKSLYSINMAFKITQEPPSRQLTARNKAVEDAKTNTYEFNKAEKSRRKAKRKEKNRVPTAHTPHPIFNIIRIAPDWQNELDGDLAELPVLDYAHPLQCLVTIEVDTFHLPRAIDLLGKLGFEYLGAYTVWDPRQAGGGAALPSVFGAYFIIIGVLNGNDRGSFAVTIDKQPPVVVRYGLSPDKLAGVVDQLFPNAEDKRIDMSSTAKRKGWICWKTSYGISAEPEADQAEPSVEEPQIPVSEADTPAESGEEEPVDFEPKARQRKLKLF